MGRRPGEERQNQLSRQAALHCNRADRSILSWSWFALSPLDSHRESEWLFQSDHIAHRLRQEGLSFAVCLVPVAGAIQPTTELFGNPNACHDIKGTTYEQVSSFVRRTVSHYSIDIHRSRNGAPIQLGENDSFNERPDLQTASLSNAVRRSGEVSKLYAALEQLNEAERSISEDKFLAGMKQAEIAAERGCDQAAVSRQIDATIVKLKKALGDETFSVLLGR